MYNSHYESRKGVVSSSSEDVFDFATDIRNFEQFIHQGNFDNWKASRDECTFTVPVAGMVNVRVTEKVAGKKVVYMGDALQNNNFVITLNIEQDRENMTRVSIVFDAEMNPVLKMMADKPLNIFLEKLVSEMESFRGWKDTIE